MAELKDVIETLKNEGLLTRNKGTNSIKSVKDMFGPVLDQLVTNAQATVDTLRQQVSLSEQQESQRRIDAERLSQEQRQQQRAKEDSAREGIGGKVEGIGKGVEGIGKGVGSAASGLGLAALFGAGAAALLSFMDFDAKKLRENVNELLAIKDDVGGLGNFFLEGGTFYWTMTGIGVGLAAFGIGSAIANVGQAIAEFSGGDNWTETIRKNVKSLMDMASEWNWEQVLGTLVKFPTVMSALGAGLAAFGIGKGLEGIGEGIQGGAEWVQKFSEGGNFGERVKKEVFSLLDILDHKNAGFGGAAEFIAVMGALGVGLAAFALGKGYEGIAEGAQEAIEKFTDGQPFAERVKSEVEVLLSILDLPNATLGNVAEFAGVMSSIGAGLAVFGGGKAVEGLAEAIQQLTGGNFAERIKDEVSTLLSIIGDPNIDITKADDFVVVMEKLAYGIGAFGLSKGIEGLGSIISSIGSFLTGEDSTIQQILKLTDKVTELNSVANSLDNIRGALEAFGNIKINVSDIDFENLAKKLAATLPLLEGLAKGGTVSTGWFSDVYFGKGLLSPDLKLDEMVEAINKVNAILGFQPVQTYAAVNTGSVNIAESQRAMAPIIAPSDNSQNIQNNTTVNNRNISTSPAPPARPRSPAMGMYAG